MPDKTVYRLTADGIAIRSNDYELSPDSNHGREVHYLGRVVGTVHKLTVPERDAACNSTEYLALVRYFDSHGTNHTSSLGNYSTLEDALEAIKHSHEMSKSTD